MDVDRFQTENLSMQLSTRAFAALILAGMATPLIASTAAIGLAAAGGSFQIDARTAHGSATLFEGSEVETGAAPLQIRLNNGVQVRLATESRAKFYGGYTILERGSGQLESSGAYPLESRGLRVFSAVPDTVARVQVSPQGKLLVAALRGSVRVANGAGVVVANLTSGLSMAFDPQVGASALAKVSGCVFSRENKSFIYDGLTRVSLELTGKDLARLSGKHLEVTGIQNPSTQVVAVTGWKIVAGGNCAKFAKIAAESGVEAASAATGAIGATAAATGATLSTAATVAVVGGVAAAATMGGLAVSGEFSGANSNAPNPNPPTSR